jgi:hypothetical protein
MAAFISGYQLLVQWLWQCQPQFMWRRWCVIFALDGPWRCFTSVGFKERRQMGFHRKAGLDRLDGGVRQDFGRIYVQFLAPDQAGLLALLNDGLKEAAEDLQPIARANAAQARVIGQWLAQIIVG